MMCASAMFVMLKLLRPPFATSLSPQLRRNTLSTRVRGPRGGYSATCLLVVCGDKERAGSRAAA